MRAVDGLGKTFRLSKNLDVQLGLNLFSLAVCCNFDRPKGSQVLCTCLAIEAGVETLPK